MRQGIVLAAALTAAAGAAPARAMDWQIITMSIFYGDEPDVAYARINEAPRGIKVYLGRGDVVEGDADRLRALYESPDGGDAILGGKRQAAPEVWLDSPGGDSVEGLRIGQTIRDLRLATVVPAEAICASACTTAFLGGVERRVEGPFLIHAAAPADQNATAADVGDTLQWLSSVYIDYTAGMIGDPTMANQALAFGSGGTEREALPLDDASLRDWSVITVAARPAQGYPPEALRTLDCAAGQPAIVLSVVCNDLPLGRLDTRVTNAVARLQELGKAADIVAQQPKWQGVRDACETRFSLPVPDAQTTGGKLHYNAETNTFELVSGADFAAEVVQDMIDRTDPDYRTSGTYAVRACLDKVYSIRVRQLEAAIALSEADAAAQKADWE